VDLTSRGLFSDKGVTNNYVRGGFDTEDTLANPAPLGLTRFGMTTVLLNMRNADFILLIR